MAVRLKDAIEQVGETMGLALPDAAVYVHLVLGGPAKVSDLAEVLHVHRNDVYRSAERLTGRGLIETTLERPTRYAAVSPENALGRLVDERMAALESLRASRERVVEMLLALQDQGDGPSRNTYKLIQGRHEVLAARNRLIESAQSSIQWLTSLPASVSLLELSSGLDRIQEALSAGVRLRAIIHNDPMSVSLLAPVRKHEQAEVRGWNPGSAIRLFIVDDETLLMHVVGGNGASAADEVAIQTTAADFVGTEQLFFEQCWRSATPLVSRGP
jgi:sugar-specific transcriptional regulator TrmB